MEVLYRGKTLKGNWIISSSVLRGKTETYLYVNGDWVEVVPETVSVFTGFKDKNGRPIYEFDIVEFYDEMAGERIRVKVFWDEEKGCWNLIDRHGWEYYDIYTGKTPFEYLAERIDSAVVVGNIIDNPDLMVS